MRKAIVVACILGIMFSFYSCKNKNNPAPAKYTGCRITTITETGSDTTNKTTYYLYYNDNGTVQRIYAAHFQYPDTSYFRYFAYSPNLITARTVFLNQTQAIGIDSLMLDGQSRVSYIFHNVPYGYNYRVYDQYQYDSSGNMVLHTTNYGTTQSTDTFQWQGGDLVRYAQDNAYGYNPAVVDSYYYADTVYNTGNITARMTDLESYGRSIYTPKHLMKQDSVGWSSVTTNYIYTLDNGGKITAIQALQSGYTIGTTKINYTCE